MEYVDVLIAGAGIAGMTLALMLHKEGISCAIADKHHPRTASRISGGVINPLPGRRFSPSWNINIVMDEADLFWTDCGFLLGQEVLSMLPIYRFFHEGSQNYWQNHKQEADRFVIREFDDEENFEGLTKHEGGVVISGRRVDVPLFLMLAEQYLRSQNITFIKSSVLIEKCHHEDRVIWNDISAKKVVWCEGWSSAINPLWSHLPFVPAKGEILTIKAENLHLPGVVSKNIFIAPTEEQNIFRFGSTYKWNFADEEPTVEGYEELTTHLKQWLTAPFETLAHDAGIRSAMRDIKPIVGCHTTMHNHIIFNGLGAKATLMAPFCARQLANLLIHGAECDREISISRFG